MATQQRFVMPFEAMTIEHLGLKLYSKLPPVISELVSNAYDADSPKVEIRLPSGKITPTSEVVIRDYGHGMDAASLQDEYLPIGRNRRGDDSVQVMSKSGNRRVTGRKGLGKLSAFGVASEMEITAYKEGRSLCLRLNYDDMAAWAKQHKLAEPYEPTLVSERTGPTSEPDGFEVCLRRLHRKSPINAGDIRRGLARRLMIVGKGFDVIVDGQSVGPGDRVQESMCDDEFRWDVKDLPGGGTVDSSSAVSGWIGFARQSSQTDRGVDIFANGKSVELGSFFNYGSTHVQFARAHLVGEVHADFLDEGEDLVATARNSVVWESDIGLALQQWGHGVLKWAFDKWLELRRKKKEVAVISAAGFDKWLASRQPSEQRVAQKMVKLLVEDPQLDPESAGPLLDIVKASVETVAFRELVETIEDQGTTATALIKLFGEWRVIEAREHLKLADGRVEAMEKLKGFIDAGALEVQQIQPLIEKHLWLINASWAESNGQTTYTELLRKNCVEPKDYEDVDRRLDILGISVGGELCILELKRPEKTLSRRDLEQIGKYVDWARTQFEGTGPDSPKYIRGLLVVGKLSTLGDVQKAAKRLASDDIRVETFGDLLRRAKEYYGEAEKKLQGIAPEYMRSRRKRQKQDAT